MSQPLRVLVVEDSDDDAALLQLSLRRGGYEVTSEVVDTPAAMRALLEFKEWDVITSDHSMPHFSAPAALAVANELRPEVPFIIVSGEIDLNLAVSLMKGGAKDYIQKRELARLVPAIERELQDVEERRERQRGDTAMIESEARFRLLFNSGKDAIGIHRIGKNGQPTNFLQVNDAFCEKLGYTREEMLKLSPRDIDSPERLEQLPAMIEKLYSNKQALFETEHISKSGYRFPVEISSVLLQLDDGQAIMSIARDITERKQAEESLRESENKHRRLFETMAHGVIYYGAGGEIISANPAAERILGLSLDQFQGKTFKNANWKMIREDGSELPGDEHPAPVAMRTGRLIERFTMGIFNPNKNTYLWLSITAIPLFHSNEEYPYQVYSTFEDITERKKMEDTLQASEERFSLALNGTGAGLWDWDMVTDQVVYSEQWKKMLGYEDHEVENSFSGWKNLWHPDDCANIEKAIDDYLSGKTHHYEIIHRCRHKNGEWRWILTRGDIIFDAQKNPVRWIGTNIEITERKKMEEALQASEEQHRLLIQHLHSGVVVHAPNSEILLANQEASRLLGLSLEQMQGKVAIDPDWCFLRENGTRLPLDEYPVMLTIATRQPLEDYVIGIDQPMGNRIWVLVNTYPEFDNNHQLRQVVVTFSDITERKRAEEILHESEEKYRMVADFTYDWEAWRAPDGSYLYISPSCERISGHTAAEFLADPDLLLQITHPEDQQMVKEHLREVAHEDQGQDLEFDFRIITTDGETCWLSHSCAAVYAEGGQWLGRRESNRDITSRKLAEDALKKSETQFRLLFQNINSIFSLYEIVLDKNGRPCDYRYLEVNAAFEKLTGLKSSELIGRTLLDVFPQTELYWIEKFEYAYMTGIPTRLESYSKEMGTYIEINIYLPQKDQLAMISNDITERKLAEEKTQLLNADLEQRVADRTAQLSAANQELEAFSYSVSHDLRAPLRSLDGFSSALLDGYAGQLDEKGNHYLSRIQEASRRMAQLINDLLDLSRVTRADFHRQRVNLSTLANSIAAELKAISPQRLVELDITADMFVEGDENLLKLVLENLLNNAYKFTSQREQAIIQVGKVEQDDKWIYFVRDNGAGFDMANVNKLFGAFQRLHSEKEFPGTGIGLATVQRIIHRHGGRVWAEGKVDKGASIFFTIG